MSSAAGFVGGTVASVLALLEMQSPAADVVVLLLFNALIYLALSYGYFNFIQLNVSSLRIRMLHELSVNAQGLSEQKLLDLYNEREMLEYRLARLVQGQQIAERRGRLYFRRSAVYAIALVIDFCKRLVVGRRIRDAYTPSSPAKDGSRADPA
ncbi:MAG: hypothetical protein K2R98_01775 [Gemmataceae bacterium]|nr:hypothetical protein [Gemmataceae bacterium]